MKREENNKLIAEFLGANFSEPNHYEMYGIIPDIEDGEFEQHFFKPSEMLFDLDWNWLMPVLVAIEDVLENYLIDQDYMLEDFYKLGLEHIEYKNNRLLTSCYLKKVYEEVLSFIKWFNLNKTAL